MHSGRKVPEGDKYLLFIVVPFTEQDRILNLDEPLFQKHFAFVITFGCV